MGEAPKPPGNNSGEAPEPPGNDLRGHPSNSPPCSINTRQNKQGPGSKSRGPEREKNQQQQQAGNTLIPSSPAPHCLSPTTCQIADREEMLACWAASRRCIEVRPNDEGRFKEEARAASVGFGHGDEEAWATRERPRACVMKRVGEKMKKTIRSSLRAPRSARIEGTRVFYRLRRARLLWFHPDTIRSSLRRGASARVGGCGVFAATAGAILGPRFRRQMQCSRQTNYFGCTARERGGRGRNSLFVIRIAKI